MDTLFAPATAKGRAGVAVVRLSGARSWDAVAALAGALPEPRRASLRTLRHRGEILDEALVLLFAEGGSFTGDLAAELHLHGSLATMAVVLRALSDQPGLRLAGPGEFTRRALQNDRLDLSQVEGLSDLIAAESEAQRRQAMRVLSGAVRERADAWRSDLIRAAALLEATIDFADEDVPVDVGPEVCVLLGSVGESLEAEIAGAAAAERVRDGFEVAIVGAPNTGKSTLLNRLAGREAAITSARAGTTRDVIEVRMDVGGVAVTLLDTAGLREGGDEIERIGIARGRDRAEMADLRVVLVEPGAGPPMKPKPGDLLVLPKADLGLPGAPDMLSVSGLTGAGVDTLMEAISTELGARISGAGVLIRERHRVAVERALVHLRAAQAILTSPRPAGELAAFELSLARGALDSLIGRVDVEHLLDEIFSRFCIGK